MEQAEKDPEVQVLARQFKSVAGDLISLLEPVLTAFLLFCIPKFAFSCIGLHGQNAEIF
jgi:hypothetical protein